jgi:hypothetical protein
MRSKMPATDRHHTMQRPDARASQADIRRMTGSSRGADNGSPYAKHTNQQRLGDHRQPGHNTGPKNRSEPPRR